MELADEILSDGYYLDMQDELTYVGIANTDANPSVDVRIRGRLSTALPKAITVAYILWKQLTCLKGLL